MIIFCNQLFFSFSYSLRRFTNHYLAFRYGGGTAATYFIYPINLYAPLQPHLSNFNLSPLQFSLYSLKTCLRPLHAFKHPFQPPSYPCFIPSLILYLQTTSYKALQSILTLSKRIFHPTLQNPVQSLTRPQMTVLKHFSPIRVRAYMRVRILISIFISICSLKKIIHIFKKTS